MNISKPRIAAASVCICVLVIVIYVTLINYNISHADRVSGSTMGSLGSTTAALSDKDTEGSMQVSLSSNDTITSKQGSAVESKDMKSADIDAADAGDTSAAATDTSEASTAATDTDEASTAATDTDEASTAATDTDEVSDSYSSKKVIKQIESTGYDAGQSAAIASILETLGVGNGTDFMTKGTTGNLQLIWYTCNGHRVNVATDKGAAYYVQILNVGNDGKDYDLYDLEHVEGGYIARYDTQKDQVLAWED